MPSQGVSSSLKTIVFSRFLSAVGYFVLVVLQALLFLEKPFEFSPYQIGLLLVIFGFGNHGLALFWAPIIPRMQFRSALLFAYTLVVISLMGIYLYPTFQFCLLMYVVGAFGLSLTNLITKMWAASLEEEKERINAFSLIYRASNAGGGIAPVIAFALPYQEEARSIFWGVGLCYFFVLVGCTFFFHPEKKPAEAKVTLWNLAKSLHTDFSQYQGALIFLLIMFLYTLSYFQVEIVPYYLKKYETLPSFMGWVLAVNPVMIVLFQGYVTKFFMWLHEKKESSGFIFGFIFVIAAFCTFISSTSPHRLWSFIVFFAIGEMFIAPHADFMISLKSPKKIQPFLMALIGVMVALGSSMAMGGGVMAITGLTSIGLPAISWWYLNTFLFLGVTLVGTLLVFRRKELLPA